MRASWMCLATIVPVLSLVAGCAAAPPATQPAPTSASLTQLPSTQALPTPTPVPPTSTPVPPTANPELPRRILFIGDSYTFWLDKHLKNLAASEDPPRVIETLGVTSGGASLEQHWKLTLGLKAIKEASWDVVVLQEDLSQYWNQLDKFYDYARQFDEEIQKTGGHTVLYMPQPWKRKTDPLVTTEDCAAVYSKLGEELGAKVAPAALAWQRSIQQRPELGLYAPDGVHPNLCGTYLSLCVIYATIFGRSPVGLSYHYDVPPPGSQENIMRRTAYQMTDFTPISEEDAAFLQSVAWATVQEYQAGQ